MGNKVDNVEKVAYHKSNMLDKTDIRDVRSVPSMSGLSGLSFQSLDSDHLPRFGYGYTSNSVLISKSILIRKQRNHSSTTNAGDTATSIELAQLTIFGYCRSMQIEVDYIIPLTIVELCLQFYYISKIVICLSEGHDIRSGNLNGLSLSDIDNDTNWKLDVYGMNSKDTLLTDNEWKWAFDSSGLCFESNINHCLPNHILRKIQRLYGHHKVQSNKYKYNAIFKCGGTKTDGSSSNYSNAIIMADGELKAWNWELPRLADYLHGNELIFDSKYGLLSIGGQDDESVIMNDVYNLKLDSESADDWKWFKLTSLDVAVSTASCCVLCHLGEEHLFIAGGQTSFIGAQNRTQIYNLDTNEWHFGQNSIISRFEGGIYYDRYMQKVYFCGGRDKEEANTITQHHEYYDIQRDVWLDSNIPFINLGTKPLIWTEGDLLYTANFLNYGFSVQFIDVRMKNKHWNSNVQGHRNSTHKHLSHVPYPQAICRLLI